MRECVYLPKNISCWLNFLYIRFTFEYFLSITRDYSLFTLCPYYVYYVLMTFLQ